MWFASTVIGQEKIGFQWHDQSFQIKDTNMNMSGKIYCNMSPFHVSIQIHESIQCNKTLCDALCDAENRNTID